MSEQSRAVALRQGVYEVWYQVWGVLRDVWLWRDPRRQVLQDDLSTAEASRQQYSGYVGSTEYDKDEDGVGQSFTLIKKAVGRAHLDAMRYHLFVDIGL